LICPELPGKLGCSGKWLPSKMKIATFNVNGVNGRLPVLVRWLAEI
jgi:hypothetical protein